MFFFFFNDTATTEIYTLSLHDALPIYLLHVGDVGVRGLRHLRHRLEPREAADGQGAARARPRPRAAARLRRDRKSTRLNSSHANISYAVFCLKKKKRKVYIDTT